MKKENLKVGAIVALKSGGPDMTVIEYPYMENGIQYMDKVKCTWFDKTDNLHEKVFLIANLEDASTNEYDLIPKCKPQFF